MASLDDTKTPPNSKQVSLLFPREDSAKRSSKSRAGCAKFGSKSERGQVKVYLVRMDHEEDEAGHRDGEAQMISDKLTANPRVRLDLYCKQQVRPPASTPVELLISLTVGSSAVGAMVSVKESLVVHLRSI
jgi:hypothetical protein